MGITKKKVNKWFIAYKERGDDLYDFSDMKVIDPEPDTYEADPFLFKGYLFRELYDYDKGVIACSKIGDKPQVILEKDYHLSYPFMIEDNGEIYMIPESGIIGQTELYRAKNFPYEWEFVKPMVYGSTADNNVFVYEGMYYLFTTISGDGNLRIYRSDSILGDWDLIHAETETYARSAGNIFEQDGKIYRPVQDCTKEYGGGMVIKEIQFNPYRETEVRRIGLDWHPELIGTHTFNFDEKYVVLDGKIRL